MNFYENDVLPARLQKALEKMNFKEATPIQKAAIPVALEGKDIIGCAQTGSGKTAAFVIPILTQIINDPKKRVLILAPTRELAAQIREVVLTCSQFSNQVRSALIVGGQRMRPQFQALERDPSLIIATPGRLMDHLERQSVYLDQTTTVILDEADRMLDMGFGPQIEEISRHLPKERQTLLFSATMPPKIKKLSMALLKNPVHIQLDPVDEPTKSIEQSFLKMEAADKNQKLVDELNTRQSKTLVFTRTKRGADKLQKFLEKSGIYSEAIHGDRSQGQRERAIANFRSGKYMILVATDVASRGLDVDQIKLVINFDLPNTAEEYIHRIGRTGRAGQKGEALSFVLPSEMSHWKYLQNPKGESPSPQFGPKKRRGRSFGFGGGGNRNGNGGRGGNGNRNGRGFDNPRGGSNPNGGGGNSQGRPRFNNSRSQRAA